MSPPPCLDNGKRKFTVLRSAATVATGEFREMSTEPRANEEGK